MNLSFFDDTMGDTASARGFILQVEGSIPENSAFLHGAEVIRFALHNGSTFSVVGVTEKGANKWHVFMNVQVALAADSVAATAASMLNGYLTNPKVLVVSEQGPFSAASLAAPASGNNADAAGSSGEIFGLPWYYVAGAAAVGLFLLSSMDGKK